MNILLIGGGGREHAMAFALSRSRSCGKLFCSPGNPGIFKTAEKADIDPNNFIEIIDFCKQNSIDLVAVGPEQPLANGLADRLRDIGINVFGPGKAAARLESSKGFAKDFMKRHGIPTAPFRTFSKEDAEDAHGYIDEHKMPLVLKADGLAAGKGVIIAQEKEEAHKTLDLMFEGLFKEAGESVVIEDFLEGEEASILAVSDGYNFITLASSQDHKRALEGDQGKNTGGMGAYSPAPVITNDLRIKTEQKIIRPAIDGISKKGAAFIGCLYAGLMIKDGEPYVVEFNVRFGDPEAQAVLPVFDGDFAALLYSASIGKLDRSTAKNIQNGASCCVVMASKGYPESYEKGYEIKGIEEAEKLGALVFHAGTSEKDGKLVASGGRVLGVTAVEDNLPAAIANAYKFTGMISFQNSRCRSDIGKKALDKLQ